MACGVCAAGMAAQAAGAVPHGVPLCAEHAVGGRMRVLYHPGRGPFHFYGLGAFVLWLVSRLLGLVVGVVVLVLRHPRTSAAVGVCVGVVWAAVEHPLALAAGAAVVFEVVTVWAMLAPGVWARWAGVWWRTVWVYRRQWQAAMTVAELDRTDADGRQQLPKLGRVRAVGSVDRVQVRGLLGQRFSEWEAAAPMVAHVFGATDVRVHRGDDRRLTLELERGRRGSSWNREGYDLGADG